MLALLSWPLSCCCDEPECGDDREDPGELCFRSERLGVDPGLSTPLALRSGLFDDDDLPDVLVIGTDVSGVSGRLLQSDGLSGLDQPRTLFVGGCEAGGQQERCGRGAHTAPRADGNDHGSTVVGRPTSKS